MRKITFLLATLFVSVSLSAQTFDFNGSDDGFDQTSGCSLTATANFLSVDLNGDANNPNFGSNTAGVDADTNPFAGVTIKNSDVSGPTFMRISYPRATGGRRYVNLEITAGDTDYVTYWFDLSNADWAGTEDDIKVHFKATGNTTYTVPTAGVNLEIDRIQFVDAIPAEEREVYEFDTDGDDEGWEALDASTTVSGSILTVTPVEDTSSKIIQNTFTVDASANAYMHIVYRNNSALNNQLRLQFRYPGDGYSSFYGTNVNISSSMSNFETLDVDLASARPEWTGITQNFQIIIRDTNNDDVTNNGASPGDFEIESIVFDNSSVLNVENYEATKFSIYPNPANNFVTIEGNQDLTKLELYDITGKRVLEASQLLNNQLSLEDLKSGVYLVRLYGANNSITVKRLIKR